MGSILAGLPCAERCMYPFARSSIVISAAPNAIVYPYCTLSFTPLSPSPWRNGLIASSHQSANAIFADGMLRLWPNANLKGIAHSNLSSALFGLSGPILNGMSYIGESNDNHNLSRASA